MSNYKLKIEFKGVEQFFSEGLYFKVVIPSKTTFLQLHQIIMECTNYMDYHSWRFEFGDDEINVRMINEDEKGNLSKTFKAEDTLIAEAFFYYGTVKYIYDFGDWNEFDITLEEIIDEEFPSKIIEHKGKFPPEDVGSIEGFSELLKAESAKDKSSEQLDFLNWVKTVKYDDFDIKKANRKIKKILKR